MRLLILVGSPFWIAHGLAIDSIPTIAGNAASMLTGIAMLCKRGAAVAVSR